MFLLCIKNNRKLFYFVFFTNISISETRALWLWANNMSRSKGITERMSVCSRSNYTYSLGKGQFYYARTTHAVCLLYCLISKQKHQILPNTHEIKSLAKELPHPIQRYLLQLIELGNAATTVLLGSNTALDYTMHEDFFTFTYILGKMSMILILVVIDAGKS